MSRRSTAFATILALTLAGAPVRAGAQEPAPPSAYDTVVLRDGTVLRGTIRELSPGRQVVVAVEGGTRTFPWSEVQSTALAGADKSSQGHVSEDIPEPAPGPSRPRIFIEVTRPADVHLLEVAIPPAAMASRMSRAAYYAAARSVCRAPCGRVIDGSGGYPFIFGGERLLPSRAFFLKDLEGDYVARVRPGRPGMLIGGVAMAGLGYAGTLAGGLLTGIGRDTELRPIGGVVLGVGLALLISGITLAVHGVTRHKLRRR